MAFPSGPGCPLNLLFRKIRHKPEHFFLSQKDTVPIPNANNKTSKKNKIPNPKKQQS